MAEELTEDDIETYEAEYEDRNERLQYVIDVLAQYDQAYIDAQGSKAEIADEHDLDQNRMYYVLENWDHLVNWRRRAMANPVDPEAVQKAYDDPELAAMASQEAVADGMGDIKVNVTLSVDQAFRAIKLLPGDLGLHVFGQVLEQADELPKQDLLDALRR